MNKTADTDHNIHSTLATRWSPYLFTDKPVSAGDLRSLFEAARWAPSSYNEQPWRFIVGQKGEGDVHQRVLECLAEGNRGWAQHAAVLALGVVVDEFVSNGKPNPAAEHDLGAAVAHLSVEATLRGLSVHQMIGIDPEQARHTFSIPANARALTAFAIGYADTSGEGEAKFVERDAKERSRRDQADFVFGASFGTRAAF